MRRGFSEWKFHAIDDHLGLPSEIRHKNEWEDAAATFSFVCSDKFIVEQQKQQHSVG